MTDARTTRTADSPESPVADDAIGKELPSWRGHLDLAQRDRVEGWAWDAARSEPLLLRILDNGIPIGEVLADRFRNSLMVAGIGDGRHAFSYAFPHALAPNERHVIDVRRADDGRRLGNSPKIIEPEISAAARPPHDASPARWRGYLDEATRMLVKGWAWDELTPDRPLSLLILDNGEVIGRVLANRHRPDLKEAGIGDGRHGFTFIFPGGLTPLTRHVIQVIGEVDGGELPGSPITLEPSGGFDASLQQAMGSAIAALATAGERQVAANFLAEQLERVLQSQADSDSETEARLLQRQLARRWGRSVATDALGARPRALVVDDRLPSVDEDAGSLAIMSHMRALQTMGYEVSFVAAQALELPCNASEALERQGIRCCRLPFYASVEEVLRRQRACFDVIYLHRVTTASLYLGLARRYGGRAQIVYSLADLHFVRLARQAKAQARPELAELSERLRQAELLAASAANAVITHSEVEANLLRERIKGCNVHVVPWAVAVRASNTAWSDRRDIAFIGNFAHDPNTDAARFLTTWIMPRVLRKRPELRCLLVGSHMVESVRQLAGSGVEVVGHVPGKVLESLAAGVPCVMSPMAAEGIALPPELKALVVDDADRMADLIVHLNDSEGEWSALSACAAQFMAESYGEANVLAAMRAAIGERAPTAIARLPERTAGDAAAT